jgi:hypothetical protein
MSNTIKFEYFENLDAIIDYLETCATENKDINGDSTLLFPNLRDLVVTYFDNVIYTEEQLQTVLNAAVNSSAIVSACKSLV